MLQEFSLSAIANILALGLSNSQGSASACGRVWLALEECIVGKEAGRVPIADLIRADSAALSQKVTFTSSC